MGLSSCLLRAPNSYARPKSVDIEIGWPTSLTGGERPGGNEFGSGGT